MSAETVRLNYYMEGGLIRIQARKSSTYRNQRDGAEYRILSVRDDGLWICEVETRAVSFVPLTDIVQTRMTESHQHVLLILR